MNEKEMNLAILYALYKTAEEAFVFCDVKPGNYTAADLARMEKGKEKKKGLKWKDEAKRNELCTVTVGAFTCSFPLCQSFALVVKFERLCSVGKAKQKTFARKDSTEPVCASVTVEVNKNYKSLADYAEDSKGLRPVLQCVCLDVVNGRAVATDGHVMRIMPIPVIRTDGMRESLQPLVNADVWRNMCEKAGKEGAELRCNYVQVLDGEKWICECCGLTSEVYAGKYPDYIKVVPEVSPSHVLRLTQESLRALKSLIKGVKGKKNITSISHEEGGCNITVTCEHEGKKNTVVLPCLVTPGESYTIYTNAKAWYKDFKDFAMYIGRSNNRPQVLVDGNALTLVMPLLPEDATLYNIDYTDGVSPFTLAGLDYRPLDGATGKEEAPEGVTCAIEQQPQETESTKDISNETSDNNMNELKADKKAIEAETVETVGSVEAITDDVPPMDETTETEAAQPEAKATTVKAKKERKGVTSLEREAKKFTFEKVAIKAGDALTFVDGTEVVAADDNKVIYEGKTYTLSGFCKSFLPDRMRNKANAYRGCEYFYKDGVRLGKLFKSYLKTLEADGEHQDTSEKAVCLTVKPSKEARHIVTPNEKESAAETKQIGFWDKLLRKAHRFAACFSL